MAIALHNPQPEHLLNVGLLAIMAVLTCILVALLVIKIPLAARVD